MIEWKLFGKVVHHPVLKVVSIVSTIVLGIVVLVLSPVFIPAHFIIRLCGLNGFYFNNHIWIGKDSFNRYEPLPSGPILGQGFRRF